ncbi:hypothetical protein TSUD_292680 [Trifolium subterraneum]|uniref:F-box domain-containing protein n=1 Tax=Trifolium subterraneum TaxID=3900 RepID=A0A2Z6NDS5_TRISU|nr:hypothetical protein TSUD_292680 [Trifolium subterraneum]
MIFGKMSEVKTKMDFIQWLGLDMSIKVLSYLDDPCDLVRVSSVSRSWNQFVIENGLCKQLFFEMFPEISDVVDSVEVDNMMIEPVSNMLDNCTNWECLKREHKVHAVMAFELNPYVKNCISKAIAASSTKNYPEVSMVNTLEPGDRTEHGASYCISHVQVVGLPVSQAFDVKTRQPSGKYTLKYCPPDNDNKSPQPYGKHLYSFDLSTSSLYDQDKIVETMSDSLN